MTNPTTTVITPLTIFECPRHSRVGRSALDRLVEWHDEELVLSVLGQARHGARRGAAAVQHGQHFVRAIGAHLTRVNVEALDELAVDNLRETRQGTQKLHVMDCV